MANRSLPIWPVMIWSAGGFAGAGKGRTFFSFSVLFIAFLGPGGSPPGAALLGLRADGVHRSRWTRRYLRLARGRSSAPSDVFRMCSPAVQIGLAFRWQRRDPWHDRDKPHRQEKP